MLQHATQGNLYCVMFCCIFICSVISLFVNIIDVMRDDMETLNQWCNKGGVTDENPCYATASENWPLTKLKISFWSKSGAFGIQSRLTALKLEHKVNLNYLWHFKICTIIFFRSWNSSAYPQHFIKDTSTLMRIITLKLFLF